MEKLFKASLNSFGWRSCVFAPFLIFLIIGILQVSASPMAHSENKVRGTHSGAGEFLYFPLVAQDGVFDLPPSPVSLPEILSFTASSDSIEEGESVTLRWEIEGSVTAVSINQGVGDVTAVDSISVSPIESTTYELTVSNLAGIVTAEISVEVTEAPPPPPPPTLPTIISFTASKTNVNSGQKVTLSWEAADYDTLRINKGIGDVTNLTSFDVFPTEDTTYRLRAINSVGEVSETIAITIKSGGGGGGSTGGPQILIFDLNRKVTESDRGFPWNQPPMENGNWVTPYNYAGGTLYVRAEIKNQPVPQQDMRLQFCFWQELNGNNFGLETCITTQNVPGTTGTVRCWSAPIQSMWKLNGQSLDWTRPRYRVAAVVKNGDKEPVSNFNGWNWNGENPKHWYPLDMRFTAIVVPKGGDFSGWGSYGGGC